MFRRTSPQQPLFGVENRFLDEHKRARLKAHWSEQFRLHALPLLDELAFAKYFCADNGRPNRSIKMVYGLLILKEVHDLTDAEAIEQLEWNAAWQHALGVTPEEAHVCQKTLHNARARLLDDDQGAALFATTTAKMIEAAKLNTKRQRMDSTHILSNFKVLNRLGLFVNTITLFLERMRKDHPVLLTRVPPEMREKYLDREGYFGDTRSSENQRRLDDAALDLYWMVRLYQDHPVITKMEAYQLLERLYREQCVPPEEVDPQRIVLQEKPSSSSLQSPSDPDVTYGHKGKGYEVQIAETSCPENPFEAITGVSVNGANESDQHQALPVIAQTEQTCGAAPDDMHADCGYGSGDNIIRAKEEHGTNLLAPIGAKASEQSITAGDFEFDAPGERVLKCPVGNEPVEHQPARGGRRMLAVFTEEQCQGCELRGQCPVERRGDKNVLSFTPADVAVARRRSEQETPEFKERHKIRSGIEATNSELKRRHGFGKLRVRRKPRVALAVRMKALAVNIKRYVQHLVQMATPTAPIPACGC